MSETRLVLTHEPHGRGAPLAAATTRFGRFFERLARLDVFDVVFRNGWVLRDGDDNILAWTSTAWETADATAWANRVFGADLEWLWEGETEEDEHLAAVATGDTAPERVDVLRASARTVMEQRARRRPLTMSDRFVLARGHLPLLFLAVALIAAALWIEAGLPSSAGPAVSTGCLLFALVLLADCGRELFDTTRLTLAREVERLEGEQVCLLVKAATARMRSETWPIRSSRKFDIAERIGVAHQLVMEVTARAASGFATSTTAMCSCGDWTRTSTRDRDVNLYAAHDAHKKWLVLAQLHAEFPDTEPAPPALMTDADAADLIAAVLATAARRGKPQAALDQLGAAPSGLLIAIDESLTDPREAARADLDEVARNGRSV